MIDITTYDMGLYDSGDPKEPSVKPLKIMDISEYCIKIKKVYLIFAKVRRGVLVQIFCPYDLNDDCGSKIHYFVDEDWNEGLALRSQILGIASWKLLSLIKEGREGL